MSGFSTFREYRVHHAAPNSLLVQLPGQSGFGKLTRETLGNDTLADRLLKSFAKREYISAVLRRTRDEEGYRLLTVRLEEAWTDLLAYPPQVSSLVTLLLRKHLLIGLGSTTAARVVRSNAKGTIFTMTPNMTAVATFENVAHPHGGTDDGNDEDTAGHDAHGAGATVEVRLLNYDVAAQVVNVTAKHNVIERTPFDTAISAAALATVQPGALVTGTVLLSSTDDGCAVVEVEVEVESLEPGAAPLRVSVLGYYVYDWDKTGKATPPTIGHALSLRVEFVPELPVLRDLLPLLVLSSRATFSAEPAVRCAHPSGRGLFGALPWRPTREEADKEDSKADRHDDSSAEPKTRRRRLEEAIDAYERSMDTALPTSAEEFQRLLLASPNSSYLWTQYMAFHVGLHQYEEARQVAEKAIQTIGVREVDERLNVWVAYLNVENLYGTAESLESIFQRALRRQLNPLPLYERLADIFAASKKNVQLLALCRTITSKFRDERSAWERLGVVLVDQGKRDQLKRMLKDMGDALKRDEAAQAIVRIAVHEYKNTNNVESARALLEGLIAKTPKKSDVWSAFLDQELALLQRRAPEGSVAHTRNLFERAVSMNFPAKVMQHFLTRFLTFEKTYGSPHDAEKVKLRAREYVEGKIQALTGAEAPAQ